MFLEKKKGKKKKKRKKKEKKKRKVNQRDKNKTHKPIWRRRSWPFILGLVSLGCFERKGAARIERIGQKKTKTEEIGATEREGWWWPAIGRKGTRKI